jgi:AhpD family alkylhydroperoxidase
MEWNDRIKELVAVGASITANCQPCLKYHTDKALEFGADPGDIAAAVETGKQVRKGASAKMDAYASEVKAGPCAAGAKNSACCG